MQRDRNWGAFMGAMREIQKRIDSAEDGSAKDPFIILQDIVGTHS